MRVKNVIKLEGGLTEPPRLVLTSGDKVEVLAGSSRYVITNTAELQTQLPTTAEFQTEMNLFGYKGADFSPYQAPMQDRVPALIIDSSSNFAAVQLISGTNDNVFAVARRNTHRLTLLGNLPRTYPQNVHLAPGGTAVLVEEANAAPNGSEWTVKTGSLVLLDSESGKHSAVGKYLTSRATSFLPSLRTEKSFITKAIAIGLSKLYKRHIRTCPSTLSEVSDLQSSSRQTEAV